MARIEWKREYSVGIEAVDHEHQELIDLVNRIHDALEGGRPADEVEEVFGDLFRAISSHFALEEKFMREHGYDRLTEHKSEHEHLLDELRDIMDDYREGRAGPADRLTAVVERWFADHFKTHDARLHNKLGAHPH